ncbi:MAG: hypothetical protein H6835_13190 [Planctomycetes bacterium]|nr:hypothetical protein [Planctomycetota bacterium]
MLRATLAVLCLLARLVAQAQSSDVSVGVFPFLVGNMDGRVNEIVGNCQSHGIDTLYVSAFRAEGPSTGTLWVTDEAGDWNPAWGSVRPTGAGIALAPLISACRSAGVRVVLVLKCFHDTVQPSDAAHRQYLLDVIDYFVGAWQTNGQPVYDIDGIALDYVRYVGSGGANSANVTAFVADVRQHIGNLSLHAYLIANRSTFDGGTYDGNFQSYQTVRNNLAAQYGQDWQQLAPLLDVLMPMAYTADGSIYSSYALHRAYVQKTAEYARNACALAGVPDRRVCPAVRTYSDTAETTTTSTIDASVTGALLGGGDGYQSFRYQHLVNHPTWWPAFAAYAVPGCNWPQPNYSCTAPKLSATVNPGATTDQDQPVATLETRFDLDGDNQFDTPWQPLGTFSHLSRYSATWRTTMQVRDADGHVATSRRRYVAGAPVNVTPPLLSAQNGGPITISLDVGPAGAGHTYLVLASLSGSSPGFSWGPDLPVPLNPDAVTWVLVGDPNGGLMSNGLGTLDTFGRATATLFWPPGVLSFLSGLQLTWSFVALDPASQPSCVGNQRLVLLLP